MSWWSWLLLGIIGPYVLAAIVTAHYMVLSAWWKYRKHIAYRFDKPVKLAIVFYGRNKRLWTMTKSAGTNRTTNAAHHTLTEAQDEVRKFFSELEDA
jgi:hypothetical protein